MYETHNPSQDPAGVLPANVQGNESATDLDAPTQVVVPYFGPPDRRALGTIPGNEGDRETDLVGEMKHEWADDDG